jgi:O-antigen/teichoic acid export membrane protein
MPEESSLAKNYMYNTLLTLTNFLFPIVTYPYVLRVIGAEGIGKVTVAATVASYFLVLGGFGISQYGLRQIARVREKKDELDKTFAELLVVSVTAVMAALALYVLYVTISGAAEKDLRLCVINGLTILFAAFSFDWFIQGGENYKFIALRSIFVKAAMVPLLFVFVRSVADYWVYALLTVLALSANNLFNLGYTLKRIRPSFMGIRPLQHVKGMSKFLFSALALGIYAGVDKLFISAFWGDSFVGYYAPADKLVRMALSIVVSLPAVAFPRMSNLVYAGKNEEARILIGKGLTLCLMLALPLVAGFELVGDQLILLFGGDQFIESISTLRILALLVIPVAIANVFVYQALFAGGREGKYNIVVIIELVCSLVLNALLVPLLKQDGAAFTTVATECVGAFLLFIFSRDMLKGAIKISALVKPFLACLIMSLFVIALRLLLDYSKTTLVISFLSLATFGAVSYALALIVLKDATAKSLWITLRSRFGGK